MIGVHGHCADCGTPILIERTHCASCAWVLGHGVRAPQMEGYQTDVTDAFADLLPEMQEDVQRTT